MKNCPYCAEEIQDAAIICRFCQRELAPTPATTIPAEPAPPTFAARLMKLFLFLLAAAGVSTILVAMFISVQQTRPTQSEDTSLAKLADARKRGALVQELIVKGLVKRVNCTDGQTQVNLLPWMAIDADMKKNFTELLASHCNDSHGSLRMSMIDAQSGRELASFGAFGYSVK